MARASRSFCAAGAPADDEGPNAAERGHAETDRDHSPRHGRYGLKTETPLDIRGVSIEELGGGGAVGGFLRGLRWLAESFAERPKFTDLRLAELVIAILEVLHRLVEPFLLVLRCGPNDSASDNVLKHLVARLIERRLRFHFAAALTVSRIGHECWVCVGWRSRKTYLVGRALHERAAISVPCAATT